MINRIKLIVACLCLMFMCGCTDHNTHHVKEYRQHVHQDGGTDAWIYWYVLTQNGRTYSYQSSPTRITDYSTITPTRTETPGKLPQEVEEQVNESELQSDVELNDNQITEQMEFDFDVDVDDQSNNDINDVETSSDSSDNSGYDSSSDSGDSGGGGE
jgi:hypothetical protein